jgi:hypothetical protein
VKRQSVSLTVPVAATQTPSTPLPGTNHTFMGLLFYSLHQQRRKAVADAMNEMYVGFIRSTDSLDLRKCLHILKRFSGLNNDELAERCGLSAWSFQAMETKNHCKRAVTLETLEGIARQHYLEEVCEWFVSKKMEVQFRQRPTKMRDTEK